MSETAAEVSEFEPVTSKIKTGEKPTLPEYVTITYKNGMTAKAAVNWGEINEYNISGEY